LAKPVLSQPEKNDCGINWAQGLFINGGDQSLTLACVAATPDGKWTVIELTLDKGAYKRAIDGLRH